MREINCMLSYTKIKEKTADMTQKLYEIRLINVYGS